MPTHKVRIAVMVETTNERKDMVLILGLRFVLGVYVVEGREDQWATTRNTDGLKSSPAQGRVNVHQRESIT